MSTNDHQLEDKEDDVAKVEALLVPLPHYNEIWDCPKIN
jgi:hypothetical protein